MQKALSLSPSIHLFFVFCRRFKWSYVTVVFDDTNYGSRAFYAFEEYIAMAEKADSKVCLAKQIKLETSSKQLNAAEYKESVNSILKVPRVKGNSWRHSLLEDLVQVLEKDCLCLQWKSCTTNLNFVKYSSKQIVSTMLIPNQKSVFAGHCLLFKILNLNFEIMRKMTIVL